MKQLLLFFPILLLTGCFQIIEEINMKADGSGEMVLTLDLSQSAQSVRAYLEAGVVEGKEIPSQNQMQSFLSDLKGELSSMPGLTSVDIQSNWSSFIFKVRCHFKEVEDIDNALFKLAGKAKKDDMHPWDFKPNFRYQNGVFNRLFEYKPDLNEFNKLSASRKVMLEQAKYMVIYRFEKAIDQFSNEAFQLSPSRKAVMLQTTPAAIATGKVKPATEITFK